MFTTLLHEKTDSIRTHKALWWCLLTVVINSSLCISCELRNTQETVPEIFNNVENKNLALESDAELVVYGDLTTDSNLNFFPDVNDIEIIDESIEFQEYPLLQPKIEAEEHDSIDEVSQEAVLEAKTENALGEVHLTTIKREVSVERKGLRQDYPACRFHYQNLQHNPDLDREALTAMKVALKSKNRNNLDKAQKLFQHAIALSPNHPEILLHYGEFLESCNDLINAQICYCRALLKGPENSRATANHRRILPLVHHLYLEELKMINSRRRDLVRLNQNRTSLKCSKKINYFQHIHHTVAIEGNTMSLDETRTIVETKRAVSGKSLLEYNEILGMDVALRHLNQTLANKKDITVSDILAIHKRVMGHVDPLTAGSFRKSQVFVGQHTPPAASELEVLMEEFVELLNSLRFKNMHPVHIAAFAHYKLVYIHPFLDGNGRTSRLLMNLLFIKYGYPPIIIKKEDRAEYYQVLKLAFEGNIRPFYSFIAQSTKYTIDEFFHLYELEKRRPQQCLEFLEGITDITISPSISL